MLYKEFLSQFEHIPLDSTLSIYCGPLKFKGFFSIKYISVNASFVTDNNGNGQVFNSIAIQIEKFGDLTNKKLLCMFDKIKCDGDAEVILEIPGIYSMEKWKVSTVRDANIYIVPITGNTYENE